MDYEVVIAGGGPVGLLLACELSLAGVSVLVLEKLADPNLPIKAGAIGGRALNIPSVEVFYRRGLLPAISKAALGWVSSSTFDKMPKPTPTVAPGLPSRPKNVPFVGHFAGIMLDANVVDYADPAFSGRGPAAAGGAISLQSLEALLAERADELKVEIRRGAPITAFETDGEEVTIQAGGETIRAGWLVGCDGGRSTVRKLAGFDFPGTAPEITGYSAMVSIADAEKLSPGWNRTAKGTYVNGPIPGRILTVEFDGPPTDREAPITLEVLQQSLRTVSETDVTLTAVHCATRWTDNARQASTYRLGRVLLAGDAAHVHSPFGGQGLNLGIGDAVNLGWKLASVVKGWVSQRLLDSYTAERHPIGAWALEWTRAQVALMRPRSHELALTSVMRDLIATRAGATYFAKQISGVWQRYDLTGDDSTTHHPLIGMSAPDLEFADGSRLGEYCVEGRALLFDLAGNPGISALGDFWGDRLRVVSIPLRVDPSPTSLGMATLDLTALFVRPDGCVAWASDGHPALEDAEAALSQWLGEPAQAK